MTNAQDAIATLLTALTPSPISALVRMGLLPTRHAWNTLPVWAPVCVLPAPQSPVH